LSHIFGYVRLERLLGRCLQKKQEKPKIKLKNAKLFAFSGSTAPFLPRRHAPLVFPEPALAMPTELVDENRNIMRTLYICLFY